MDADGLPLIGPSVDYRKVEPLNQKKTISLLNHFIMHTSGFLNRFSSVCEQRLSSLTTRLQRLETQMTLLEGKLTSIPGLDQVTAPTATSTTQNQAVTSPGTASDPQPNAPQPPTVTTTEKDVPATETKEIEAQDQEIPTNTVAQDPRYAKYFRMLGVGVPEMAVKQKMAVEGLDPNLLSTPNAAMPSGSTPPAPKADSASDFSDDDDGPEDDDDSSVDFSD